MSRKQPRTDGDEIELETIAQSVDELAEKTAMLEELGAEADLPVVELTARRISGVVAQLEDNVPVEIYED